MCCLLSSCQLVNEKKEIYPSGAMTKTLEKQKGAHVFRLKDTTNLEFLHRNNIEWVTLVPWGFQDDFDSPDLGHHHGDSLEILRRDSSWVQRLERVHNAGLKVFLKPHVWLHSPSDGKWRSDIFPTTEQDWELWKEKYREFILRYARVAERGKVEMFCIGTEFTELTKEYPEFWRKLIEEVRTVYSGKLTYAANWYKEYEQIAFWHDLDYIGVQAYFPLTKKQNPSIEQLSKGWEEYTSTLQSLAEKHQRKILFTEMGYKSTKDSAIEPWTWIEESNLDSTNVSMETQAHCYQAFYSTIWPQKWFAGVHIWQYNTAYENGYRSLINQDFTPQGKPTEKIIAQGFAKQ